MVGLRRAESQRTDEADGREKLGNSLADLRVAGGKLPGLRRSRAAGSPTGTVVGGTGTAPGWANAASNWPGSWARRVAI
jgi:hypothetical protein